MAGTRIFRIIDRTPVFSHPSSDGSDEEAKPVVDHDTHPRINPGGQIQDRNGGASLHHAVEATNTDDGPTAVVVSQSSSPVLRPLPGGGKAVDKLLVGEIRLERVTFAYPARPEAPIITNLSWSVPAGRCEQSLHVLTPESVSSCVPSLFSMSNRAYVNNILHKCLRAREINKIGQPTLQLFSNLIGCPLWCA